MKFYIICPKTDEKIYLCLMPENPYEMKVKLKDGFWVDGCETRFKLSDIKIEPEDHFYFILFACAFTAVILMAVIGIFSLLIIGIAPWVSEKWFKREEKEVKRYLSIIGGE